MRVKTKLLSLIAALAFSVALAVPATAFASDFSDVPDNHWAEQGGYIDRAIDRGIAKGYSGTNKFGPDDKVLRGQVVLMLMRGAGVDETAYATTNQTTWTDAGNGAYYTSALNWAYENGILNKTQTKVRPNDPITRQELCVMLANYATEQMGKSTESDTDRLYKYPDRTNVATWATSQVSYAVEQGIIGASGNLNPGNNATRAETIKMLLVFLDGGDVQPALYKSHFIDVGQGDSTFIEFANGKTMLIDAGDANAGSTVVNFIKERGYTSIDYLVATHPDADHIGGMSNVISAFNIGGIYMPDFTSSTQTFEKLLDALEAKGLKVTTVLAGDNIGDSYVELPVTIGNDSNANSVVLLNTYGTKSYLYAGDADAADLATINRKVDVLKVSHHGSNTGTNAAVVSALAPSYAVISCGANNSYGHPTDNVLSALKNALVYRTDTMGTISSYSDGNSIWFNKTGAKYTPPASTTTPSTTTTTPSTPSTPSTQQPSTVTPNSGMVYITPTGSKYHRATCSTLSRSKNVTAVTVAAAKAKGLDACKVCKP